MLRAAATLEQFVISLRLAQLQRIPRIYYVQRFALCGIDSGTAPGLPVSSISRPDLRYQRPSPDLGKSWEVRVF